MSEEHKDEFRIRGDDLVSRIRELIHEGSVRRIIIKNEAGKVFMEIPLTVGVLGAVFAPVLAAVGALAALVADFTVEVIRRDESGG